LLLHCESTIPVVWGVRNIRLLLPVAAREWSDDQLRSVLLYELAHIKRRDTMTQLLAQFACALYWFNPLVWFAAWRRHVEREQACDDLVLCNGVAASAYAEHLLNVATRLTSSPWTQGEEHRLNTPLKSRLLYHNNGKETVFFRVVSWNRSGSHKVTDAAGVKIDTQSTMWTTIGQVKAVRLAPGEFAEVIGAGIGVGANNDEEDWRNTRVGTWIHAKTGDKVTFTPDVMTASGSDGRQKEGEDSVWWLSFITKRLDRDAPMPDDDNERERILDRAVRDLFGTPPTPVEIKMLLADKSPDAMSLLAKRLSERAGTKSAFGNLQSGPTTFRVLLSAAE
jgi:hypothetical protein